MEFKLKTEIKVIGPLKLTSVDLGEDEDSGSCKGDYVVQLYIGDHQLEVRGWVACGWVQAGAKRRPNGQWISDNFIPEETEWWFNDYDGEYSGRPEVYPEGNPSPDTVISVGADNRQNVLITSEMVPEWDLAVQVLAVAKQLADASDDPLIAELEAYAMAARDAVAAKLTEELASYGVDCNAPAASEVYYELEGFVSKEPNTRAGNYRGAGNCIAWMGEGGVIALVPLPERVPDALEQLAVYRLRKSLVPFLAESCQDRSEP